MILVEITYNIGNIKTSCWSCEIF